MSWQAETSKQQLFLANVQVGEHSAWLFEFHTRVVAMFHKNNCQKVLTAMSQNELTSIVSRGTLECVLHSLFYTDISLLHVISGFLAITGPHRPLRMQGYRLFSLPAKGSHKNNPFPGDHLLSLTCCGSWESSSNSAEQERDFMLCIIWKERSVTGDFDLAVTQLPHLSNYTACPTLCHNSDL